MLNKKLKEKILKMVDADLEMRKNADNGEEYDTDLDKDHTKEIKGVVNKHGWPTVDMVGKRASWGAWLLVQHADHDIKFQKKCLELMILAFEKDRKSIVPFCIASLTDRVLVNEGKKQLFGTQFDVDKEGNLAPSPIKDIDDIDKRRKKYGLGPYEKELEEAMEYKSKRA